MERLNPDLKRSVREINEILWIYHPYVIEMYTTDPWYVRYINKKYASVRASLDEAFRAKNYLKYLQLITPPFRAEELNKLLPYVADAEVQNILKNFVKETRKRFLY